MLYGKRSELGYPVILDYRSAPGYFAVFARHEKVAVFYGIEKRIGIQREQEARPVLPELVFLYHLAYDAGVFHDSLPYFHKFHHPIYCAGDDMNRYCPK